MMVISLEVNPIVIANHSTEEISSATKLSDIFTRKQKYWMDGSKITVFIKPINSVEHKMFVMEWLQMSHFKYKEKLGHETFSGNNSNVIEVKSDGEMLAKVAITANSIGYIDNKILVRGERDVKIISSPP